MPMRLRNVWSLSGGDCGLVSGWGGRFSPSSRSRMLRWDMMLLNYLLQWSLGEGDGECSCEGRKRIIENARHFAAAIGHGKCPHVM